ncbi:Archaellum protein D/E [Halanaeroarchaeum sp. HSR-CO]|uniref:FlaD/FlaE family flagellar protein n=1 Tax=Halanaeroarchaeum sp. HSR-CO TaxID=2866382 RepID=UPI00217DCC18|nr:FlaD/FlaE family flagellar protein [Halanaeroarchaeum sp. HSR-CO]UWG48022.1 Archaellum protein D/E [Halanaeroarchaeum sp. HSR-CO]
MTINPGDYDPEDLRRAAREELDSRELEDLRSRISAADTGSAATVKADQVKELVRIESGADPTTLDRPYLTSIPDQYAGRLTLFEWLDFVLRRAGVRRTLEALEYYEKIGWISGDVAEELRDHVRAFRDVARETSTTDLETTDHVLSLVYVARLASMAPK